MNETNTVSTLIIGFFMGFMFALGLVCIYQFLTDQFEATPYKEVRAVLAI